VEAVPAALQANRTAQKALIQYLAQLPLPGAVLGMDMFPRLPVAQVVRVAAEHRTAVLAAPVILRPQAHLKEITAVLVRL